MTSIKIKHQDSGTYLLAEYGEWVCSHADAYVDPACCSGYDSEGNISCGCYGRDSVVCPNTYCTGIEDWQVDDLFEVLQ